MGRGREADTLVPALFQKPFEQLSWRIGPLGADVLNTLAVRHHFPSGMSLGSRIEHLNNDVVADRLGAKETPFLVVAFSCRRAVLIAPALSPWRAEGACFPLGASPSR
jgi:hypothetical protein